MMPLTSRSFITRALLAATALAVVPAVYGQQSPSPQPPRFRGGTNLVRVDVFATKDGVPVADLTARDIEVYEDGARQTIDQFEHITVAPALTQEERTEPVSVDAARQMIEDAHRRVFVLFLDTGNVGVGGSHDMRRPLIDLLTKLMGPDDLVAVMTPDMNPAQLTFARRTAVLESGLTEHWYWGRKGTLQYDEQERRYDSCYPPAPGEPSPSPLALRLMERRRERIALDSLEELVSYLSSAREGRTAVITVTNGWALYGPDESLTRLKTMPSGQPEPIPGMPPIGGLGPNGGLTTATKDNSIEGEKYQCDRDRMELAMMDDEQRFRDIWGDANRAAVSFYPIDPRGLAVFDSDIGPDAPPPPSVDRAILKSRGQSLRTLAINTGGIALLGNNDLEKQVKRVSDDLTSYYLIGYYSTNTRLDGKFREIKVRVVRPGVEIRARRGYRAATQAEVAAARAASDAPVPTRRADVTRALGSLQASARESRRPPTPDAPLVFHRGFATGNRLEPATQRVFPRSDRLRLELVAPEGVTWSGALLDRNGHPLAVPVTTGERNDPGTGERRLTADVTLAPLGPGDYIVSLTRSDQLDHPQFVAVRVTQQ